MKSLRFFLPCAASAVLLVAAGCHKNLASTESAVSSAAWTRSELFFGQSMPGGAMISAAEWQRFVDEQITPAFSEGLTILDASGQYKTRSGAVSKEPAKIVILVYKNSSEKDAAIRKFIDEYKQRFRQESVLWTSEKVDARF
jgi:hypothetical protein